MGSVIPNDFLTSDWGQGITIGREVGGGQASILGEMWEDSQLLPMWHWYILINLFFEFISKNFKQLTCFFYYCFYRVLV